MITHLKRLFYVWTVNEREIKKKHKYDGDTWTAAKENN